MSAMISSYYTFRLIYYVFIAGPSESPRILKTIAEGSIFLYFPLILLTILSIFSGYYLKDLMVINASLYNFDTSPLSDITLDQDFSSDIFKILPSVFALLGIFLVYVNHSTIFPYLNNIYRKYLHGISIYCKKFLVDSAYSIFLSLPSARFALKTTYNTIDQGFLELGGSSGSYAFIDNLFKRLAEIETTLIIYRSLLFVVFALGILLSFVLLNESVLILLLFLCLFNIEESAIV